MQRTRDEIDALKAEIEQLVDDRVLTRDRKIDRLFRLRKPEEVSEADVKRDGLNFWLNRGAWATLKLDREFWLDVIHRLGFVDVEATNEMGNKMFSLPEIASILGDDMAFRMMQQGNLFDLPVMEQQHYAKNQFMDYMLWYDERASMNYLVLYGRFLALNQQLVPLERTREHRQGDIITAPRITSESTYHVVSHLTVVAQATTYAFFFYQQKQQQAPFVIQQGTQKNEVPVTGPILRVLKFFYPKNTTYVTPRDDTVFLVLWGPQDNKLLRFNHRNVHDVMVVDKFVMNPDDFDDLTYVNSDTQPTRFATNAKSAKSLDDLKIIDLSRLSAMLPQQIRRLADLTREEKRRLAEQRQQNMTRESVGYLDIQTEYDYGRLFARFPEPITVRFLHEQAIYQTGQVELLAVRLVRVPGERSEAACHLAALVRQYTSNEGAFHLQLRLYRYQPTQGGQFTSFASRIIRLDEFLTPSTESTRVTIAEMNLIFHTHSVFYVEVMERRTFLDQDEFGYVTSRLVEFDFLYAPSLEVVNDATISLVDVKDASLFEALRMQRYRLYDYRHDTVTTTSGSARYDAVFYRYNVVKAHARLIFYKAGEFPTVVEYRLDQLKPHHLLSIVPLPKLPNIAFLSFKKEELRETPEGTFRIITLEEPSIVRLSLADGDEMTRYTPETFSLATQLQQKLTVSSTACVFCGDKAQARDKSTGKLYCDRLCQELACRSYRLY